MGVRQYNFSGTGVETGTQPDTSDFFLTAAIATTLSNNVSTTTLTGALVDKTGYKGAKLDYVLERYTDSSNVQQTGTIWLVYDSKDLGWRIVTNSNLDNEALEITFSVTSGGQIQYTTSNISGSNYGSSFRGYLTKFLI